MTFHALTLAAFWLALATPAARAAECALALALALDISSSVNEREYAIQKDGLAAALRDPEVRAAALANPGSVWIAAYEWSGWQQQDMIADWQQISSAADLDALSARIEAHQRTYAVFSTAIGEGLQFGERLMSRLPKPCLREVIDVSGDGVNNEGLDPKRSRANGRLAGITVNALVIKGATPDPEPFYRDHVIGGPGAFMMIARNGFEDYPDMIIGKLVREIMPPVFIGALDPTATAQ
ncbi:MAG: DUF1194 domain-containing protein [Pseudomonadota bacterium]